MQWYSTGQPIRATEADDGEDPDGRHPILLDVARTPALPGKTRLAMWRPGAARPGGDLQAVLPHPVARKIGFALIGEDDPPPVKTAPVVGDWRTFLRDLDRTDDKWRGNRAGLPDMGVANLPYPERQLLPLLFAAIRYVTGNRFLDVGCGPGTQMRRLEAFGFDVYGIDYLPGHVAEANRGRPQPRAVQGDARDFPAYHDFDLLLLNRPMEGAEQRPLELVVMGGMRPGAVLINVNGSVDPGRELGWTPVYVRDEPDPAELRAKLIAWGVPELVARQLAGEPQVIEGVWQKPAI